MVNWKTITSERDLEQVKQQSYFTPQVIFKHSTSCGTSFLVKESLEEAAVPEHIDFNFLDLLKHRGLSNRIASEYKIRHESPQILLIKNGTCTYYKSHAGIRMTSIAEQV